MPCGVPKRHKGLMQKSYKIQYVVEDKKIIHNKLTLDVLLAKIIFIVKGDVHILVLPRDLSCPLDLESRNIGQLVSSNRSWIFYIQWSAQICSFHLVTHEQ